MHSYADVPRRFEFSPGNDICSEKAKQLETVENNLMKDCEIMFLLCAGKMYPGLG